VQLGEPNVASAKAGAALFTAFVKGVGFPSMRNTPRAKKGQIGIGHREWRIEDQKTRTLEHRKCAPPVSSKSLKGLATRPTASSKPLKGWATRPRAKARPSVQIGRSQFLLVSIGKFEFEVLAISAAPSQV
jgi:hypothetical protein